MRVRVRASAPRAALLAALLLTACWPGATAEPVAPATPTATGRPAQTEPISSPTPQPQATASVSLPWATPGGPPPTPMPVALRNEITDAYLRYWRVRSDAVFQLNPELLPQVLSGDQLERERQEIDQLRLQGNAAVIRIDHSFQTVYADQDLAIVYDEYRSRSYTVDADTKRPPGPIPETPRQVRIAVEMRKVDGLWKVTDSERFDE